MLADDFHDRALYAKSISPEEDNRNIKNLTKLNNQLSTKFLYTVIQAKNKQYYLTSSSALDYEIKNHTEVHYFTPYPDASKVLKNSFKHLNADYVAPNKIYKPSYVPIYSDRWGTYRSIVLPIQTEKGNVYVIGVDMDITYVNRVLKENTIQTLLSFLLFLLAIIPIIITYKNILKDKQKAFQEISKKSITDPLTGLYNRYKLDKELQIHYENYQKNNHCFALLIIDLDHFKKINDKYGHKEGDEVLKAFAKVLKQTTRLTDIVGRWGGEEFLIIYPNSNLENGLLLAQKLHNAVENSVDLKKHNLTISIGIGTPQNKNLSLDKLVKDVDKALYRAKEKGRNQTIEVE